MRLRKQDPDPLHPTALAQPLNAAPAVPGLAELVERKLMEAALAPMAQPRAQPSRNAARRPLPSTKISAELQSTWRAFAKLPH